LQGDAHPGSFEPEVESPDSGEQRPHTHVTRRPSRRSVFRGQRPPSVPPPSGPAATGTRIQCRRARRRYSRRTVDRSGRSRGVFPDRVNPLHGVAPVFPGNAVGFSADAGVSCLP
jgi:hypothetical protein